MTLTLQKRFVLALLPLVAFLLILGILGVVLLYWLGTRADAILRENYDSVIAMEHLDNALERIDSSFQFTLAGREASAKTQYDANWKTYRENLRVERANITIPGEKELADELTALTERYEQQGKAFYASVDDVPRRNADYFDAGGLLETFTKIKSVAGQIARINQENMEEASRDAHRTAVRSLFGFAIGLVVCIALVIFAASYIYRAIVGPVWAVTQSALRISTGNLDQVTPYLSGDVLGQLTDAFNHLALRLGEERQSTEERTRELLQTTEGLRTEITVREKMESELRRLAAIVESSDDAIVGQTLDGIITTWNKGAERIYGFSSKMMVGQSYGILVPPEYHKELPYIRELIGRGEYVDHFETVRKRKDGQRIYVSLTASPVKAETGEIIGVSTIARDVTLRRQTEEVLNRAAAYNQRLLEASLDPLVTIGPDGKITDVNAATEAATGCSRSELVGTDFADYFTKPEKARSGYQQVFSEGSVRDYALELRHRDGHIASVLYNAAVFRDEVGKVVGVFAAARDITQRKQAEEKVQRLALLQGAVAELGQRALRTQSSANLMDEAVLVISRALDVDFCNVLELLPGGEELLLRAGVGWKEEMVGSATVKTQGTQPGYVIRSECPVIVKDAATETRFTLLPQMLGEEVVSAMSVVIATPEGPYGALGAHSRRKRTFSQDEVNFLQAVANVLGSAVQRKRSEARLRRSNRSLVALSSCNKALIRASEETDLLQRICQIVVEKAGYRLCWVGYAEQDEGKTVRPMAQAGYEEGYLKTVNVTWADTERGQGPTGTCIRTGRTTLVKNMATDPQFAPWRADALKRGYVSSIGIPLVSDSIPFGALTIYAPEPEAFDDEEVQLLTELVGDLVYGVMALRTKAEHKKAVEHQVAINRETEISSGR